MTSILIEEQAYNRLEHELRAIDTALTFIVMKGDGLLYLDDQPITLDEAKPEVAWLNVGVVRAKLSQPYIQAVLAAGTVKWLQTYNAGLDQPFYQQMLARGIVGHAILDVFDPEPLPSDSPLWDLENVLISPHSSNAGENTPLRGDLLFLENLRRYLAQEPLLNEA